MCVLKSSSALLCLSKTLQFSQIRRNMVEVCEVSSSRCFGGDQKVFSHYSKELDCRTNFSLFLPPQAEEGKVPVLYWLSGLTCTEQNFIQKSGAQRYAAEHGVALVGPDTSPRGMGIPDEEGSWDLGSGAGFYVDATAEPWCRHYRMYSYVTKELPELVHSRFPLLPDCEAIMGHSMGGHGALVCALRNPGRYRSVSAFAPICNPSQCPWGRKAFAAYLGEGNEWKEWDATELVRTYRGPPLELFIDQGKEDPFLKEQQLLPERLVAACKECELPLVLRMREGYNHSYYFISSFIGEHVQHHARALRS